ncbi:hypothetical protein IHQ71_31005 (plasmid) [Rhizobium sp. TH2]|uniref:hypothetical protein n=1 Tax=Rhizobium sp. TH2 TaxID=2775403 RepID=UPI00215862ED|nr:hypothetical protein [Rhizobium sp. TH2]UVC12431.1 hypothetical protein IHQ71_31005 [Rhizobium sp. TH2]
MRKILIGGIAALIAATSLATTAEAGNKWRHGGWNKGHHAGWNHRGGHHKGWKRHGYRHGHRYHARWGWRGGVWIGGPTVVIGSGCVVKKKIKHNGVVVKKRYC